MTEKRFLGAAFALRLKGKTTLVRVAEATGTSLSDAKREVDSLSKRGLVQEKGGEVLLTQKGRGRIRVVFIGGGFEIIHRGHLHTIEQAKNLGDVLVAVVARDSTIRKRKGREPATSEAGRVRLLSALRQVDVAILGARGDIYETLERVRPDVVALGYDQYHLESDIAKEAKRRGIELDVVRLDTPYPGVKTSRILKET